MTRLSAVNWWLVSAVGVAAACFSGLEPDPDPVPPRPPPPPAVTLVSPREATVAPGDTVHYQVIYTNIPAADWRWEASDAGVVTVDSTTGLAVARRAGQSGIRACAPAASICAAAALVVR